MSDTGECRKKSSTTSACQGILHQIKSTCVIINIQKRYSKKLSRIRQVKVSRDPTTAPKWSLRYPLVGGSLVIILFLLSFFPLLWFSCLWIDWFVVATTSLVWVTFCWLRGNPEAEYFFFCWTNWTDLNWIELSVITVNHKWGVFVVWTEPDRTLISLFYFFNLLNIFKHFWILSMYIALSRLLVVWLTLLKENVLFICSSAFLALCLCLTNVFRGMCVLSMCPLWGLMAIIA